MHISALRKQLTQSLADFRLSRREKQELRDFIEREGLGSDDLREVRSIAFELATVACDEHAIGWLDDVTHVLATASRSQSIQKPEMLFSPRDDCPARIQSMIRKTKSSLDICVFTITDDVIANEILNCHQKGVDVRIISDNEKAEDRGSDVFRILNAGVPVALDRDGHMHHKFAVFDRELSLTGSYNWTRSAARYNHENILLSYDPEIAAALLREFDALWRSYSR
ncbi:MAG: cardiolipin hydrolase [Planctomycetota bacterium]|jgi:cardiolipin hydrolase